MSVSRILAGPWRSDIRTSYGERCGISPRRSHTNAVRPSGSCWSSSAEPPR